MAIGMTTSIFHPHISSGEKRLSNWNKLLFRVGVEITWPERPGTSLPRPRYFLVRATSNASTHDACTAAIPRLEMRISVSFGGFPLFWLASANFLPFSIPRATRITQPSFFFPLSPLRSVSLRLSSFVSQATGSRRRLETLYTTTVPKASGIIRWSGFEFGLIARWWRISSCYN